MTSNKRTKNILSLLCIAVIFLSLIFSLMKISSTDFRKGEQWKEYYTLITSDASPVEEFLINEGLLSFISLNQSKVYYNAISRMDSVSLKDLANRFYPLDPRYDPYLKNAAGLFSARSAETDYELLYIEKNSISILNLFLKLYDQFRTEDIFWSISGFRPLSMILPVLLMVLYILFFTLLSGRKKFRTCLCTSMWLPFVFLSGLPALAAAVSFSYVSFRRKTFLFLLPMGILLCLYVYKTSALSLLFFLSFVCGFLPGLFFYENGGKEQIIKRSAGKKRRKKGFFSRELYRIKIKLLKPDHELFIPVTIMTASKKDIRPIKGNRSEERQGPGRFLYAAVLFIFFSMVFLYFDKSPDPVFLPVAEQQNDLNWSLEHVAFISESDSIANDLIISPADYIKHLRFQEGFLYGTEWEYPNPERPLLYPVYEVEGNGFSKSYKIQADYSEKWFNEQISSFKNDNPAKLLFSTENPGFVIKKSNHYNNSSFMLLKISFSMLLLLLLILSGGKKRSYLSLRNVKKKLLRRNEQVA